jgi:hypothetical protein
LARTSGAGKRGEARLQKKEKKSEAKKMPPGADYSIEIQSLTPPQRGKTII